MPERTSPASGDTTADYPSLDVMVRELWDRDAIAQLPRAYVRGFDSRDWDLVRSCFTEDAEIEGGLGRLSADESLGRSRDLSARCVCTVHFIGTQLVDVDGNQGYVESWAVGYNWMGEPAGSPHPDNTVVGSRYQDTVVRANGRWRISYRRLVRDWSIGGT